MISVIIAVYNEEKTISECLASLNKQSLKDCEIIVVDDGSTDESKVKSQKSKVQLKIKNLKILSQRHQGPGMARNLGAKYARGDILVFVDADMTFERDFIKYLIAPILKGETKGTFTKEEYVSNWDNVWARCWNYNEGISTNRRVPETYPLKSPVFRAIFKSEFEKVGGFDNIGFTDDWTLSRKLRFKATVAERAICYHKNPSSLGEVYRQSRWIGKNEFISGSLMRRLVSLAKFNIIFQLVKSVWIAVKFREALYPVFQLVYGWGLHLSIYRSFFGEAKSK